MIVYDELYIMKLEEARKDIDTAITVWKELLRELDTVEFAYVKGSAIKEWETEVDYVPLLSDLDIHIGTTDNQPLFPKTRQGFLHSLEASRFYEERLNELRPDHLHIPRIQIVLLQQGHELFYPEKSEELNQLMGIIPRREEESEQSCQIRDLEVLLELKELLERQPERMIDRIGLEYYRIIRSLCYIVSPTPVRVLSQYIDSKKAWRLNRTKLIQELEAKGLDQLASVYRDYYHIGWEAFEAGFNNNEIMRQLIQSAYDVLWYSYIIVNNS